MGMLVKMSMVFALIVLVLAISIVEGGDQIDKGAIEKGAIPECSDKHPEFCKPGEIANPPQRACLPGEQCRGDLVPTPGAAPNAAPTEAKSEESKSAAPEASEESKSEDSEESKSEDSEEKKSEDSEE